MSWAILILGALAFADVAAEPTRVRRASREAKFTAVGARFPSPGLRLLLFALGVLALALLTAGGWALLGEAGVGSAAPAIGFGLFFLACALGGTPREPHLFFGESRLRVGGRRLAYAAFVAFDVDGDGRVVLEGRPGRVRGRITPGEVHALREFLTDRVLLPPSETSPAEDR